MPALPDTPAADTDEIFLADLYIINAGLDRAPGKRGLKVGHILYTGKNPSARYLVYAYPILPSDKRD